MRSILKNLLFVSLFIFSLCFNTSVFAADVNWTISPSRTNIKFKVKHFVLMEVEGRFKNAEGIVTTSDEENFSNAHVEAKIPVQTISTGNTDRDAHLVTGDFFDAQKYPEMSFKSKKVISTYDDDYKMIGDLSIHGITKEVEFKVKHSAKKVGADGIVRSKFSATSTINRYDFGLKWNELTETGSMVVGDKVAIEMDVTLELKNANLASIAK